MSALTQTGCCAAGGGCEASGGLEDSERSCSVFPYKNLATAGGAGVLKVVDLQVVGLFQVLLPMLMEWMHLEDAEGILLLCQVICTHYASTIVA
jgi:hypothetical protein